MFYTEDNLRQLHGIQESIQRMRQVSVQTLRLQVSDVIFELNIIRVPKHKIFINGLGRFSIGIWVIILGVTQRPRPVKMFFSKKILN